MVAVLSGQDITDRVRAEAELRKLAFFDTLTGLPNRAQLESRLRAAVTRARRRGAGGRAAAGRPRQLQARQRLARPRRRRPPAAAGRRAAARRRGRGGAARPPRRRRVPDAARRPRARGGRARGARGGRSSSRCGWPSRSRSSGAEFHVGGEHRHLAVPRGRRRRRGAAPARRRGDVPEQGPRPRGVDGLLGRHAQPARAALAVAPPAAGDRPRRARAALPADRVDRQRAPALDGGAAALAGPRARARASGRLHPGRRGDGPARPDRRLGGRCADGADRRVARRGPRAARVLQRVAARAAAARLRRRARRARARAPASTRRC